MVVRSGRLLPSVIVGALVTGALALGAGVASAEPITLGDLLPGQCIDPETREAKTIVTGLLRDSVTGMCEVVGAATAPAESGTENTPAPSSPGAGGVTDVVTDIVDDVTGPSPETDGTGSGTDPSTTGSGSEATSGATGGASTAPAAGGPVQAVVQPPSALPAPDVRGALLAPAVSAPGGLAARVPALGFGAVDPRLLMVPTGSPLRTLTGVTPGSPVTTSSDVQAMALDGLPSGLGTPAVLGVLILSTLAGFALRHRVLRRVRLAAAPEPDPAA